MSFYKAVALSILALVLTVPWFISSTKLFLGLPAWAFYSLVVTIIYSCVVAYLFQIFIKKNKDKIL